jgi:hypothetical protein
MGWYVLHLSVYHCCSSNEKIKSNPGEPNFRLFFYREKSRPGQQVKGPKSANRWGKWTVPAMEIGVKQDVPHSIFFSQVLSVGPYSPTWATHSHQQRALTCFSENGHLQAAGV